MLKLCGTRRVVQVSKVRRCCQKSQNPVIEQGKFRRRADGEPDMVAILRSLLEIASGMAYLHSLGVLHGAPLCC